MDDHVNAALQGIALYYTAASIVDEVYTNYQLTSTLVTASELRSLQIEAIVYGLVSRLAPDEAQATFIEEFKNKNEFIEAITTRI